MQRTWRVVGLSWRALGKVIEGIPRFEKAAEG